MGRLRTWHVPWPPRRAADLDAAFTHTFEFKDGKIVRFNNEVDEGWAAGWS